jgi:TIR domain-containing protein
MAHDVFISHSTSNRPVANAVCAALERDAIRCWIAPRDVMPGRSYSGEITRAIQQSRAFVLIFSEHSNNSEQVLREVQLAANSRLHIVQFRIDAVAPSDDLEYFLSGPHWLDAMTPPLENHLAQLQASVKALLALPRAGDVEKTAPAETRRADASTEPIGQIRPPAPVIASRPAVPLVATKAAPNVWKWVALAAVALTVVGGVALFLIFSQARPKPAATIAEPASGTPVAQMSPAVQPTLNAEPSRPPASSIAAPPTNTSVLVSAAEAERFAKAFYREMERGDVSKAASYLDETVDYYAFGPKDKAFVAEQMRQFLAALPMRSFDVNDVKVQDSSKPAIATVIFDVRYSARDALGNAGTGHTRVEWDLAKRADGLKIVRSNWMTYPDPTPSH